MCALLAETGFAASLTKQPCQAPLKWLNCICFNLPRIKAVRDCSPTFFFFFLKGFMKQTSQLGHSGVLVALDSLQSLYLSRETPLFSQVRHWVAVGACIDWRTSFIKDLQVKEEKMWTVAKECWQKEIFYKAVVQRHIINVWTHFHCHFVLLSGHFNCPASCRTLVYYEILIVAGCSS